MRRAGSARIIAPDRRICAGHGMHVESASGVITLLVSF